MYIFVPIIHKMYKRQQAQLQKGYAGSAFIYMCFLCINIYSSIRSVVQHCLISLKHAIWEPKLVAFAKVFSSQRK